MGSRNDPFQRACRALEVHFRRTGGQSLRNIRPTELATPIAGFNLPADLQNVFSEENRSSVTSDWAWAQWRWPDDSISRMFERLAQTAREEVETSAQMHAQTMSPKVLGSALAMVRQNSDPLN